MSSDNIKLLYSYINQHVIAKAIIMACDMQLDQFLGTQTLPIATVAQHFNYHPDAFARFLRLLAAHDVFIVDDFSVKNGNLSRYFDHIRSPHLLSGFELIHSLSQSLRTNNECYSTCFGHSFQEDVHSNTEHKKNLSTWAKHSALGWLAPTVLANFDFSVFKTIYEIKSDAYLLASIIKRYPHIQGGVIECRHPNVRTLLEEFAITARITVIDSIEKIPKIADAYLFCRNLLWLENHALAQFLHSIATKICIGKIIIIDFLFPHQSHSDYKLATIADLNILTCLGGALRTEEEWLTILKQAGLKTIQFKILKADDDVKPLLPLFLLEQENRLLQ